MTCPTIPYRTPTEEFDFWEDHVWSGFRKLLKESGNEHSLGTDGRIWDLRKRQLGETRVAFRNRVANRVSRGYSIIKPSFECLGFDIAVLLANHVIDRRLTESEAMRIFDTESARLVEKMNTSLEETSRRLGLSLQKQLKEGKDRIELAKPFRIVADDLKSLVAAPMTRRMQRLRPTAS
jgi:hypothetical protein